MMQNLVYMLIDNFTIPLWILMNGKGPYLNTSTKVYESFTVAQGNEVPLLAIKINWCTLKLNNFFFFFSRIFCDMQGRHTDLGYPTWEINGVSILGFRIITCWW
jgi:hypothetical protein